VVEVAWTAEDQMSTRRWYHTFFGVDFCQFADDVVGDELARETAALGRLIAAATSTPRVLDVACGIGTRALALAQEGFDVVGFDVSPAVLEVAAERASTAGAKVQWEVVDPLAERSWPDVTADAALCLDCVGWGSDVEQRRLFRRLRRRLPQDGMLVVRKSSLWLEPRTVEIDGIRYELDVAFDAETGRATGALRVSADGEPQRQLPLDLRIYSLIELRTLLTEAGFRVDGPADGSNTLLVARSLATPPGALAVASWKAPPSVGLDLRYAPDEAVLLSPQPQEIWESLVRSAPHGGDVVGRYAVDDPYGGQRGAVVVGGYFRCGAAPQQVTFGAGVTPLLHDLCGLADGGPIAAPELVHADLEAWGVARGSELRLLRGVATVASIVEQIDAMSPALVHFDRPAFTGHLLELSEVERIVAAAAECDAVVVIDESALTYLGGLASAGTLVPHATNLVVLRGFTKAYSLGGMRAGFAFSSASIAARVRELVAPLQVGELALQAALRLLSEGDIFHRLRTRVQSVKPRAVELLESVGLEVYAGHPALPWVAVSDAGGVASQLLESRGIRALRPAPPPGASKTATEILRLTLPLSTERWELFERFLIGGEGQASSAGTSQLDTRENGHPSAVA
jgi:histidinol-phosphate/aromatic aminotransferase/cobyric acid decarboxylase-like protein/SAM-dependent methyltransferase